MTPSERAEILKKCAKASHEGRYFDEVHNAIHTLLDINQRLSEACDLSRILNRPNSREAIECTAALAFEAEKIKELL